MSLEAALKENTEAVLKLAAALAPLAENLPAKKAAPKAATPAAEVSEELAEPAKPAAKAPTKPVLKAASTPAAKADEGIDPGYAPVKAAILDAINNHNKRPEIAAMFKKYGVKNGQELDSSVYDEVLGEIDAIVNGEGELA